MMRMMMKECLKKLREDVERNRMEELEKERERKEKEEKEHQEEMVASVSKTMSRKEDVLVEKKEGGLGVTSGDESNSKGRDVVQEAFEKRREWKRMATESGNRDGLNMERETQKARQQKEREDKTQAAEKPQTQSTREGRNSITEEGSEKRKVRADPQSAPSSPARGSKKSLDATTANTSKDRFPAPTNALEVLSTIDELRSDKSWDTLDDTDLDDFGLRKLPLGGYELRSEKDGGFKVSA